MLFFILLRIEHANTVQEKFRLTIEATVFERFANRLFGLKRGQLTAVVTRKLIPRNDYAVVNVVFLINEFRLDNGAHRDGSLGFEIRFRNICFLNVRRQSGNQSIAISLSMSKQL